MAKPEYFDGTEWRTLDNGAEVSVQNEPTTIPITGSLTISAGSVNMTLGVELDALSAFSQNGIMVRTGIGNYAGRTLEAGFGMNITNGNGVSGNPSIAVNTNEIQPYLWWCDPYSTTSGNVTIGYGADRIEIISGGLYIPNSMPFWYFQTFGYLNYSGNVGQWTGSKNQSIRCGGDVAAREFQAISSIKRKNIILKHEDMEFKNEIVQKFDILDFVKYQWKDQMKDGIGDFFGIIAENLAEAFPNLVNLHNIDYAPNIMIKGYLKRNGDCYIISLEKKSPIKLKVDEIIQIFCQDINSKNFPVSLKIKTISEKVIEGVLQETSSIKLKTEQPVFVYGREEIVPKVSKTRFHDMIGARLKILVQEVNDLKKEVMRLKIK